MESTDIALKKEKKKDKKEKDKKKDKRSKDESYDVELGEKVVDDTDIKEAYTKWDYVMMFGDIKMPKDKDGKPLPDTNKAMARFKDVQAARKKIVTDLQQPTVGLHVSRRRSTDGNTIFVLVTASIERLMARAEEVELNLKLKEKHGGAYAPFEVEHKDLYQTTDDGLFLKIQRMYLIQSIMEEAQEFGGAGLNLNALVREGHITRGFGLHNKKQLRDLVVNWSYPRNLIKPQPLHKIRDYFGEEIAMYFAWLGFYTQWLWYLTAGGLIVTFFWAVNFFDPEGKAKWTLWSVSVYCVFLSLWSTCYLEFWKRYKNGLVYEWGMSNYQDQEKERPDFHGEALSGVYSNGIWVPLDPNANYGFKLPAKSKYYPKLTRASKMVSQLPLMATMIVMVVILTLAVMSFRLFVQNTNSLGGSIAGGVANAITIMFMNVVWKMVAVKLNNWENHRTDSEYENSLIMKIFAFYFVNSYTALFYVAFFKGTGKLFGAAVLKDACKTGRTYIAVLGNGCMDELTIQLITVLMVNIFVGQSREVAIPWLMGKAKVFMLKRNLKKQAEENEKSKVAQWEIESKKPAFPGTFDEYSEMVIQFGYITMFAASFPIAPLLAVLNNVIEIRTDAFKLLDAHSRPEYRGATGIGAWYSILEGLGILAVITNCLLIGFSLNSVADIFGEVPVIPTARRISQVPFHTFVVIVLLEHILIFIKFVIAFMIPDMPGWIIKEQARQDWIKNQTLKVLDRQDKQKVWKDTVKDSSQDSKEDMLAKKALSSANLLE
eukprot:TRINITY_DN738_c0_g1_i1.p1 TRINITY_DN738_c0_g1~~TRINITY_DN738_c0_g1_i1.p1  ORF type:complete len:782 (+),score=258.94 TRINITY_DN738_c0_g1_i1:32-2347(+)